MSSDCLADKREKSTRGMAQGCQNRLTLTPRSTVPRLVPVEVLAAPTDYAQDGSFNEAYWGSWPGFACRPARGSQSP